MPANPLADALRRGRFCYVVELVASALRREAQLLDAAARLARLPDVVAGSITRLAASASAIESAGRFMFPHTLLT